MQTIELNLRQCSWDVPCKHVVDRFDRDQFTHFIRMFLHAKQTGSVIDYISHFDDLMHQLLAHGPLVNPVLLTSKFVVGLREDVRAIVILHRPKDLILLALLPYCRKRC